MRENRTTVVLYSHDALGLGHLRRNLALAHQFAHDLPALTTSPVAGLLMVGTTPPPGARAPKGFDWLVLPGLVKRHGVYVPRSLNAETATVTQLRSQVIHAALQVLEPDLVVVDRHPYGMHRELQEPLRQLRTRCPRTRVVLGLREVLDDPAATAVEWSRLEPLTDLRALFDEVWVYGDRQVHDPVATGEVPEVLADRTVFTGYLADGRHLLDPNPAKVRGPFVLTTVGGGADGDPLLRAAARMLPPAGHRHVLVAGPQATDQLVQELQTLALPGTLVYRTVPGLSRQIERASAVISMGGYNTACELMSTTTPALIVPREQPRQEQLIRARALERTGAVEVMRQSSVTPERFSRWAALAVRRRVNRRHLDRDGLRAAARMAATVVGHPPPAPEPTVNPLVKEPLP